MCGRCYLVPAMWTVILDLGAQLPKRSRPWLRVLRNAGAALPHDMALQLAALFPQTTILPTYGMTEVARLTPRAQPAPSILSHSQLPRTSTSRRSSFIVPRRTHRCVQCMPIAAPPLGYRLERPGSVGPKLANMKIIDRSLPLTDSELPVGEIGEIAIFGLGEEQLFPGYENEAGAIMPMANGIFGTGDLGRVDADGWLYIVGRSKEVTTAD